MFTTEELQAIDRKCFTVIVADPLYQKMLASRKQKYAGEILKLSQKIMDER